ncbi:MAG: sulfate adenylyltransferase, partial [Planctomycetota bacterium]
MIKPHGSDTLNPLLVSDARRAELEKEAEGLPKVVVSSATAANAVMMGSGYFNPLTGYMDLEDALMTSDKMVMKNGTFFPVPVLNLL